ncbi:MAG: hypothetical protein E2O68_05145 [Deltaproteobacteria bacterium]|nr:MAG: hypothetical protein E2O68_05145 [Deltaproteobacteria bacterium]
MKTIFEYECYKKYLNEIIQNRPKRGRGTKKNLAEFLRCKTSLISAILSGDRDFSLDQAIKICQFFSLNPRERDFLIFLVGRERAATTDLKDYYDEKMQNFRAEVIL